MTQLPERVVVRGGPCSALVECVEAPPHVLVQRLLRPVRHHGVQTLPELRQRVAGGFARCLPPVVPQCIPKLRVRHVLVTLVRINELVDDTVLVCRVHRGTPVVRNVLCLPCESCDRVAVCPVQPLARYRPAAPFGRAKLGQHLKVLLHTF